MQSSLNLILPDYISSGLFQIYAIDKGGKAHFHDQKWGQYVKKDL